jgi:hypothetical protein
MVTTSDHEEKRKIVEKELKMDNSDAFWLAFLRSYAWLMEGIVPVGVSHHLSLSINNSEGASDRTYRPNRA